MERASNSANQARIYAIAQSTTDYANSCLLSRDRFREFAGIGAHDVSFWKANATRLLATRNDLYRHGQQPVGSVRRCRQRLRELVGGGVGRRLVRRGDPLREKGRRGANGQGRVRVPTRGLADSLATPKADELHATHQRTDLARLLSNGPPTRQSPHGRPANHVRHRQPTTRILLKDLD